MLLILMGVLQFCYNGTCLLDLRHSQWSYTIDSNVSVTVLLQWYFLVLFLLVMHCSWCSFTIYCNRSVLVLL